MTRDKKAISTPHSGLMGGLMCGLLVFTGVFCLCNPVSAASDTLPPDAYHSRHHGHQESAASLSDCSDDRCPDCDPDALGQTSPQELKVSHSVKLEPNAPDVDSIFMAPGSDPPSGIAFANPQAPPPPHVADTPVRRWDLLLE